MGGARGGVGGDDEQQRAIRHERAWEVNSLPVLTPPSHQLCPGRGGRVRHQACTSIGNVRVKRVVGGVTEAFTEASPLRPTRGVFQGMALDRDTQTDAPLSTVRLPTLGDRSQMGGGANVPTHQRVTSSTTKGGGRRTGFAQSGAPGHGQPVRAPAPTAGGMEHYPSGFAGRGGGGRVKWCTGGGGGG